jgi:SAM-dependent methyltransferase
VSTGEEYQALYEDYYASGKVDAKRAISARQSVGHIKAISQGLEVGSILDIGAGEGAVLDELSREKIGAALSAIEISGSGIEAIEKRKIPNLQGVRRFDGYKVPYDDQSFDLGLALHVLEHVEHERMFLAEAARVCRKVYVEVPLEHLGNLRRSIRISGPYGHINFYTRYSLENLIKTTGLTVDRLMVFTHDLAYEQLVSGDLKGRLKHLVRKTALRAVPDLAQRTFVYMAGVLCSRS